MQSDMVSLSSLLKTLISLSYQICSSAFGQYLLADMRSEILSELEIFCDLLHRYLRTCHRKRQRPVMLFQPYSVQSVQPVLLDDAFHINFEWTDVPRHRALSF